MFWRKSDFLFHLIVCLTVKNLILCLSLTIHLNGGNGTGNITVLGELRDTLS